MDIEIRFIPSSGGPRKSVRAAAGTTLMDAARRAGLPIANACGADHLCGRCGLRIVSGAEFLSEPSSDEERVKARNRIDPALRLACFTSASGDVEVTAAYW